MDREIKSSYAIRYKTRGSFNIRRNKFLPSFILISAILQIAIIITKQNLNMKYARTNCQRYKLLQN